MIERKEKVKRIPRERIQMYAKSRVRGKSRTQAARDAGVSEASASVIGHRLEKLPETQELIAEYREKYDCGVGRVFKELDRGLKEADVDGKHVDYVDRLMRVNDIGQKKEVDQPQTQVVVQLLSAIQSAEQAGIIPNQASPSQEVPELPNVPADA